MSLPFAHRLPKIVLNVVGATALLCAVPVSAAQPSAPRCEPAGPLVKVPELPEGSGMAASRKTPGRFWSHNDSGEPVLVALDGQGRVSGRVQLAGAAVDDWEAVAVGPCPSGSCIYVGDIGDNDANRKQITIYRVAEPAEASGSVKATDVFHASYPDGAHDAESLLIGPDGRLHIVTKGDTGAVALYRFPSELREGTTLRLERVGGTREPRKDDRGDRITDGAVSPDGRWVVLRSGPALMFYGAADFLAGKWHEAGRVATTSLREPQGEGVAFGPDGSIYLISEGGGKKQPGTFARLTCTLNP
jgi:hypothetical protein